MALSSRPRLLTLAAQWLTSREVCWSMALRWAISCSTLSGPWAEARRAAATKLMMLEKRILWEEGVLVGKNEGWMYPTVDFGAV